MNYVPWKSRLAAVQDPKYRFGSRNIVYGGDDGSNKSNPGPLLLRDGTTVLVFAGVNYEDPYTIDHVDGKFFISDHGRRIVIGAIVGPLLGGFIGNIYGLQAAFWIMIPSFILLALRVNGLLKSIMGFILPLVILASWEIVTRIGLFPEQLLASPERVFLTFIEMAREGDLASNLRISLVRVTEGFSLGLLGGFLAGTAMALSRRFESYIGPMFHGIRQVPIFGWIPLLILWIGIGESLVVTFVAIAAFYPMVLNTYEGIRNVPKEYLEVADVFKYGRFRLLRKVVVPAAMPSIFTGIKNSLGMSWMSVVGAELIGSSSGIGFTMVLGRQLFQMDIVMVGLAVISIVGLTMHQAVNMAETYLLRWRKTFVE